MGAQPVMEHDEVGSDRTEGTDLLMERTLLSDHHTSHDRLLMEIQPQHRAYTTSMSILLSIRLHGMFSWKEFTLRALRRRRHQFWVPQNILVQLHAGFFRTTMVPTSARGAVYYEHTLSSWLWVS